MDRRPCQHYNCEFMRVRGGMKIWAWACKACGHFKGTVLQFNRRITVRRAESQWVS